MKSLDAERRLETTVAASDEQATLDVRGLREFFRDSVHDALIRQQVGVDAHTEHYVVNLLTMFSRSELFEQTPEGVRLRPLAVMLAEAAATTSAVHRSRALRLGDVSLFVAGFFAQSLRASWSTSTITSRWAAGPTGRWPTAAGTEPARARSVRCSPSSPQSSSGWSMR